MQRTFFTWWRSHFSTQNDNFWTLWKTDSLNRGVVYRVGILLQHFGTPPQLLEHHPIEDSGTTFWNTTPTFGTPPHRGFWDNFLEHHPNTTPSRILGQLFGAPPKLLEHHPNEDSGKTFRNTTPSTQQREHQPARVGVLVQPLEHRAKGPRPREWDTDGRSRPAFGRRKK